MKAERRRQWRNVPVGWEVQWRGDWWIIDPPHFRGSVKYRWFRVENEEGRGVRWGGGPVEPRGYVECRPTARWAGERTYVHT